MQRALGLDAFIQSPYGTYMAGRTWLVFCASESERFFGLLFWGVPDQADVGSLLPVLTSHSRDAPHAILVDARRLIHVDPAAFGKLMGFLSEEMRELARVTSQVAILHGKGVPGAVAAGCTTFLRVAFPAGAFRDATAALEWLGRTASASLFANIEAVVEKLMSDVSMLGPLAALLEGRPDLELPTAARLLSVSPRSLQRKLLQQGTSFQRERDQARVRIAQRLLAGSYARPASIAAAVGTTPRGLKALFRRSALPPRLLP